MKRIPFISRPLGESIVITFPSRPWLRLLLSGKRAKQFSGHFVDRCPVAYLVDASVIVGNLPNEGQL